MATHPTRRRFLKQAAVAGGVVGLGAVGPRDAAASNTQLLGVGRIQENLPGQTLPSPSDFGFTATSEGGQFVCSMFGPETGGFLGCDLMTVEGIILPNTLEVIGRTAFFRGRLDLFLFPDVINQRPYLEMRDLDFRVTATLGGPGKATMILLIPATLPALGAPTGGIVEAGRIEKRRVRA